MTKDQFLNLHKQYCVDTAGLSYIRRDCPAYIKLLTAGAKCIPWALERLQDSIGHDYGNIDDLNSPWLSTDLLYKYTDGACLMNMPEQYAGKLDKVRGTILAWGKTGGLI